MLGRSCSNKYDSRTEVAVFKVNRIHKLFFTQLTLFGIFSNSCFCMFSCHMNFNSLFWISLKINSLSHLTYVTLKVHIADCSGQCHGKQHWQLSVQMTTWLYMSWTIISVSGPNVFRIILFLFEWICLVLNYFECWLSLIQVTCFSWHRHSY